LNTGFNFKVGSVLDGPSAGGCWMFQGNNIYDNILEELPFPYAKINYL